MEVARPTLRLREKVPPWVIPSETIKVINQEKGLVAEKIYRPSLHSKIKQKLYLMTEQERDAVYKIIRNEIGPKEFKTLELADDRKAFILDTLLDAYRFRKANKTQDKEEDTIYRKFLLMRTELPRE